MAAPSGLSSRIGRWFAYATGAAVAFVLAGAIVLQTDWAERRLRDFIVRQANRYLTATLGIDRIEGSFLRGVVLQNVTLSRDGHTFIQIERVVLAYDIGELFDGGTTLRTIRLERPRLRVTRDADGRWNLANLLRSDSATPRGPQRPLHLPSILIERGSVVFDRALTFGAVHVPSRFDDLIADLALHVTPNDLALEFRQMSWRGMEPDLVVTHMSGQLSRGTAGWDIDRLAVETPRSRFLLTGQIDRRTSPTQVKLTVDADRFVFPEWGGTLAALQNMAIQSQFRARLDGPLDALTADISLLSDGGDAHGRVVLDTTVSGWRANGSLNLARLNLARWLGRSDRPSDISGDVTFDLQPLADGRIPRGTYAFQGPRVRFMGYSAESLTVRGKITSEAVEIAGGTATAYGAHVTLTSGEIRVADPYGFAFVGTATGLDLRRVPAEIPVPHVDSQLALRYDLSGQFVQPFIKARAEFDRSLFLDATIEAGATGRIDTSRRPITYAGEGELARMDLHRFGEGLGVEWMRPPRYAGRISGRFHVEGAGSDLATLILDGGGHLTEASLFKGRLLDADVAVHVDRGTLVADYHGVLDRIDPASVFGNPQYEASLTGRGQGHVTVRDITATPIPLADYDVAARMDLTGSSVRGIPLASGHITASLADGTLRLSDLHVEGRDIDLDAEGALELDGVRQSRVDYRIRRGELGLVQPFTGRAATGTVTTSGQLTGPLARIRLRGFGTVTQLAVTGIAADAVTADYDITIPAGASAQAVARVAGRVSSLQIGGQVLREISGNLTYDRGSLAGAVHVAHDTLAGDVTGAALLDVEAGSLDLSALSLSLKRSTWSLTRDRPARLTWAGGGVAVTGVTFVNTAAGDQRVDVNGTWNPSGGGSMHITALDVSLDALASRDDPPAPFGGFLSLDATIGGTSERPVASGVFGVTRGRLWRVAYDALDGRVDYADGQFTVDLRLDQSPGTWFAARGNVPASWLGPRAPREPMRLALTSSAFNLGVIEGLTTVVHDVSGELTLDVVLIGTPDDPHLSGQLTARNVGFVTSTSGARYSGGRAALRFANDRVTVEALHLEDADGDPLDVHGSLGTHELRVSDLAVDVTARNFEVLRNAFGRVDVDAALTLTGQFEQPRLVGRLTITRGQLALEAILDETMFRPYATQPSGRIEADALRALNPWDRLGLDLELHVPNTLRMSGDNVQITPGTPIGLGNINLRALGDLYLYKDPGQPLYVNGSLDSITGTYVFQGRRFELSPDSSLTFRGDLNPELYVTVVREISGVETRVTISGLLREPELRLASTPPLEPSDILSLIVFNTSMNQLSALQQDQLAVRAGTLAAGFIAAPMLTAIERSLGLDVLEIGPSPDANGARITIGNEIVPGLVARFSRQFGESEYDEATLEYYLSRILRIRATFSDAGALVARSPFRRVERAGVDLLLFFSF